MHDATYPEVPPDLGNYLAGLIDGEGCFAIWCVRRHADQDVTYACHFSLSLREDDAPILRELQQRTGLGNTQRRRAQVSARGGRDSRPALRWVIQSKADCRRLVELLQRFPLRAKKKRDFTVWAQAVQVWQGTSAGGGRRVRNEPLWLRLAGLKGALESGRAFTSAGLEIANDPSYAESAWLEAT